MRWREYRYQRKQLYEEVWAEPATTVAKRYGISSVALAKICRKLAVPLPPRGYWTLVEIKKAGPRPPLPPFHGQETISVTRYIREEKEQKEIDRILENEMNFTLPSSVLVAAALHKPHPLVEKIRSTMKGSNPGEYGVIRGNRGELDLRVSPACLGRALRIYDALIKAIEGLGWRVAIGGREDTETHVIILGEKIQIGIEEGVKRTEHILTPKEEREKARGSYFYAPRWDYHPTGELTLRIKGWGGNGLRKSCSDGKQGLLEEKIAGFLEILRKYAAQKLVDRRERERQAAERAAEQARLAEIQARREEEKRRIQQLETEADAWRKAELIRSFVHAAVNSGLRDSSWAQWALDHAMRIDPLQRPKIQGEERH